MVGIVSAVCNQAAERTDRADQIGSNSDVVDVAGGEQKYPRAALRSVRPWSFVVRPPRERPIPCAKSPFCASGGPVGF